MYEAGVVSAPYGLQLAELAAAPAVAAAAAAVGLQHNLLLLHQPQDSLRVEHVQPLMFCTQNITQLYGGFGSGSGLDSDSIRSVDPDPYSESGSGSRRAKITHKSRKKSRNFMF